MAPAIPVTEPSTTLVVLDLVGIFVFAVTGALVGVRKELDVFGILVLAGTTGLGGGFLRDVLIDATPPAALEDWRYLLVPVAAGLLTFWFHPAVGRRERAVTVLDAFGLGLFCVTGTLKALEYGLGPVPAALMGMVTGIGGGMARDLLAGRVPVVFRGDLYATPALAGAFITVAGSRLDLPVLVIATAGAGVCIVWRLIAMWRNWQAPMPTGPASV
ncbi:trimeric intracellular cation channel family protein [Nocardioides sp. MAHUQ-72]|uniref:trimeric intracellular cation channel family protein n=1 Tax=unclassified Nocardioides TaxID=2615069 RepID=UPI003622B726